MKIRMIALGTVALVGLVWTCWSVAYTRGYSRGALDEFACWKQVPMTAEAKVLIGHRDPWLFPGGRKAPEATPRFRSSHLHVNKIPSKVSP